LLDWAFPLLFAVLVWWASTGAILFLDGLDRRTFGLSLGLTGVAAIVSLILLYVYRDTTEPSAAYLSFAAAVVIWGWNEMAFLMGIVTGPRREPADPRAEGWARFRQAAATVIWHELTIAASAIAIVAATWGGANQVGFMTFAILWLMRLSAKLNIHWGAPNVAVEFLPPHLAYLGGYFRRRAANSFFPFAVTAATIATFLLARQAAAASDAFGLVSYTLAASLAGLAVLEHWLLFVPLSMNWLWNWSLRERAEPAMTDNEAAAPGLTP